MEKIAKFVSSIGCTTKCDTFEHREIEDENRNILESEKRQHSGENPMSM